VIIMHISQETPEATQQRLRCVIAQAELKVFEGDDTFARVCGLAGHDLKGPTGYGRVRRVRSKRCSRRHL
jgi:hypothetical protein